MATKKSLGLPYLKETLLKEQEAMIKKIKPERDTKRPLRVGILP